VRAGGGVTVSEIEELCMQLEIKATGANAHTASKARTYLRKFATSPDLSAGALDRFVVLVRKAIYSGEWQALSDRMARWW
jgi:hypothetical protein